MGSVSADNCRIFGSEDAQAGTYRKIFLRDWKISGAVFLGEANGETAVRELFLQGKTVAEGQLRELGLEETGGS